MIRMSDIEVGDTVLLALEVLRINGSSVQVEGAQVEGGVIGVWYEAHQVRSVEKRPYSPEVGDVVCWAGHPAGNWMVAAVNDAEVWIRGSQGSKVVQSNTLTKLSKV